jgi:alkanesulfonate monooxygenase SsuD/methylene tetrahydromethanopterin reductase-like flavin-dependent oxidoreductase (luciferase family)
MGSMTIPGPTGVVLRDPLPWPELRQVVETAEDTGYAAVFVPEITAREAFVTLVGFALATNRLSLGTGVVTLEARSAGTTAMAAASLQDLSGGRAILGIGAGSSGSLGAVRRYVGDVRSSIAGLELSDEARTVPIWLGALGDGMVSLAGEVADGVLLNWCTPERVARAATIVREAAERAGRDPSAMTIGVYVRACLGIDEDVAIAALGAMVGRYAAIPHYRRQFEAMGLGEAARPSGPPDAVVRALTVAAGRTQALARFDAFREAGADLVLCYPVAALEPLSSVMGTVLAAAPDPAVER